MRLVSGWWSMSGGGGGRRRHWAKPSPVLDDLKDVEQHLALLLSEVAVDKLMKEYIGMDLALFYDGLQRLSFRPPEDVDVEWGLVNQPQHSLPNGCLIRGAYVAGRRRRRGWHGRA